MVGCPIPASRVSQENCQSSGCPRIPQDPRFSSLPEVDPPPASEGMGKRPLEASWLKLFIEINGCGSGCLQERSHHMLLLLSTHMFTLHAPTRCCSLLLVEVLSLSSGGWRIHHLTLPKPRQDAAMKPPQGTPRPGFMVTPVLENHSRSQFMLQQLQDHHHLSLPDAEASSRASRQHGLQPHTESSL
ncbi:uncharacterized protein LOC134162807 isoform X2 [Pezoporus occidentalis]|uniref:uncharacterized protein LOC134162807 isoform X2 n=1 Tax=Pezoporus occidentalis TaxID=407982 RepID=UPI002F90C2B6